ncbi:hypothetical protein HRW14_17225 [Streptomyces lunaelactis]|uniref:hypothetical protein n=1 Tax=Streptomyces lunaelactis TaxID=1535768 RepID=UPI001585979F|nr:hypothetical protein [Streptomyces lunaelactis]NUK51980.1 hypothetical protein [Streptomyces lunaelactis]NUK65076.1 hypothetical protein [Streptomyces lunaelactis]
MLQSAAVVPEVVSGLLVDATEIEVSGLLNACLAGEGSQVDVHCDMGLSDQRPQVVDRFESHPVHSKERSAVGFLLQPAPQVVASLHAAYGEEFGNGVDGCELPLMRRPKDGAQVSVGEAHGSR